MQVNSDMVGFQKANCARGCRFAERKLVGSGKPCCTFSGKLEVKGITCKTRRQ